MRTLLLLAIVPTLAALSACGGGESPTGNGLDNANMSGTWTYQGSEIESPRFTCIRAGLALDLRSFITSFSGIASGAGTSCQEKSCEAGGNCFHLNIGPIGSDSVRGTVSGNSVNFDLPALTSECCPPNDSRKSSTVWTNQGVVVGDSMAGELSILFTWRDDTRHTVTGKWTAVRR